MGRSHCGGSWGCSASPREPGAGGAWEKLSRGGTSSLVPQIQSGCKNWKLNSRTAWNQSISTHRDNLLLNPLFLREQERPLCCTCGLVRGSSQCWELQQLLRTMFDWIQRSEEKFRARKSGYSCIISSSSFLLGRLFLVPPLGRTRFSRAVGHIRRPTQLKTLFI